MRFRVALIGIAMLVGCATPYQKQGLRGGFDETQLAPTIYRVSFKGNAYTSADRAADLALLRCADLALENGYGYFAIVDAKAGVTHQTITEPTRSYTTGTATANTYGGMTNVFGSAQTTTYGGATYTLSKPSATNTIVLLKSQSEFSGMTYDAKFLSGSLGAKYRPEKE